MKYKGSKRLQAGLGTEVTRDLRTGKESHGLMLGRVLRINYKRNTIDFIDVHSGAVHTDKNGARLPTTFGGRNGYGKSYGVISPIRVNDIVLVGFVNDNANYPMVINRYVDNNIAEQLNEVSKNNYSPNDDEYANTNRHTIIYPDQTYDDHEGDGTRTKTFNGKSFLRFTKGTIKNGRVFIDYPNGGIDPGQIKQFGDLTPIKANNPYAPRVLFQHMGKYSTEGDLSSPTKDHHILTTYIDPTGILRVSAKRDNEKWVSTFTMNSGTGTKAGTIRLRRQNNNDEWNDRHTKYGEFFINHKNTVTITSGDTRMRIINGHHIWAEDVKGTDKIDLYQKALYTRKHLKEIDHKIGLQSANDAINADQINNVANQANTTPQDIQAVNTVANAVYGGNDPDTSANPGSSNSSNGSANSSNGSTNSSQANNLNYFAQSTAIANTAIDSNTGNTVNASGSESTPQIAAVRNFNYTLTAYNVQQNTNVVLAFYDLYNNFIGKSTSNGSSGNVTTTMKAPDNTYYIKASIDNPKVNVKLEQSDKPSNWTPNYIDLTTVGAVRSDVLSQAQTNANNALNWQSIINSDTDKNYLLSLVQTDGKVLVSDSNGLQAKWQTLETMIDNMVARANAYQIDTNAVLNANKALKTSITFILGNNAETSVDDYQTNVNGLFNALKSLASSIVTATSSSVTSLEKIPSFNDTGVTNYLLGTTTPVVISDTNMDVDNQVMLYKMSGQAANMTGPMEFYCKVQGDPLDATVNVIEILNQADGSTQTVQLANNVAITSGTINQNVTPVVPQSNQTGNIALQVVGYDNPLTVTHATLCNQVSGDNVWSPAPEDIASTTQTKIASLTVAPDQITSTVFDTLLQESDIFTQTADRAEIAVTKGDLKSGIDAENGILTLFGNKINIVGDFIDNSMIRNISLQDANLSSSSSGFTLNSFGVSSNMQLNMATIQNAKFIENGFNLDLKNVITSNQAQLRIDNTGINFTNGTGINQGGVNTKQINSSNVITDTVNSRNTLQLANKGISITPLLNNQNYTSQESGVTVDGTGKLLQTVSALAYGNNVAVLSDTINKGKTLLGVAPKSWTDKNDSTNKNQVGLLADDLVNVGMTDYVLYDGVGKPMGVQYGKILATLLPIIQQLVQKAGI